MDAARTLIREPDVDSPRQYRRRVLLLAVIYIVLFTLCLVGIGLLLLFGCFFVGLSQRSNVEMLVIAFFLVLFGYLALITSRSTTGQTFSASHTVDFEEKEPVEMVVDVPAPPGSYTAELEITFPPT